MLRDARLAWLRSLPAAHSNGPLSLVDASPETCWRAPAQDAPDVELQNTYGPLGEPIVIFGHTHSPFIRTFTNGPIKLLINAGSVGLPYDGDRRASYLLLDDGIPTIRRVAYDIDRELKALADCGLPGADWTARMIRAGAPQLP